MVIEFDMTTGTIHRLNAANPDQTGRMETLSCPSETDHIPEPGLALVEIESAADEYSAAVRMAACQRFIK